MKTYLFLVTNKLVVVIVIHIFSESTRLALQISPTQTVIEDCTIVIDDMLIYQRHN